MSFVEAIKLCLRQYAGFSGRATRAEYWWFYLFTCLVGVAANVLDVATRQAYGFTLIGTVASLAFLLPSLAVAVRRLHDSDLAEWWILAPITLSALTVIALFVTLAIGFVAGLGSPNGDEMLAFAVSAAATVVLGLAAIVVLLVLFLRPSTPGPNRFGPHPGVGGPGYGGPGYGGPGYGGPGYGGYPPPSPGPGYPGQYPPPGHPYGDRPQQ